MFKKGQELHCHLSDCLFDGFKRWCDCRGSNSQGTNVMGQKSEWLKKKNLQEFLVIKCSMFYKATWENTLPCKVSLIAWWIGVNIIQGHFPCTTPCINPVFLGKINYHLRGFLTAGGFFLKQFLCLWLKFSKGSPRLPGIISYKVVMHNSACERINMFWQVLIWQHCHWWLQVRWTVWAIQILVCSNEFCVAQPVNVVLLPGHKSRDTTCVIGGCNR